MRYTGDATINVGFSPKMPKPLDDRLIVDSESDIYKIDPSTAYEGMSITHAKSGFIFVLVDKTNIDNPNGWRRSYETLQVETLTKEQYDERLANTDTSTWKAIDVDKPYIQDTTYYYITEFPEDELKKQNYVSLALLEDLLKTVNGKVLQSSFDALTLKVDTINNTLQLEVDKDYVEQSDLDISNEDSKINTILKDFKNKSDEEYVSKSQITGEGSDDDYIFIKKTDFSEKIELINNDLSKTLKTDGTGNVETLTANTINATNINLNSKTVATKDEIPKIEYMSLSDYESLENKDEDTYYMTYGEDTNHPGYITADIINNYIKDYLDKNLETLLDNYNKNKTDLG